MSTTGGRHRSTALVAVGQGAVKAQQLVVALVLVRLLSPTSWDQVALLLTFHLAIVTFGTLGMQHSLLYFLANHPGHERRIVLRTAAVMAAVGLLCAAALTAAAQFGAGSSGIRKLLPVVGLAAAMELSTAGLSSACIATERFVHAAVWDLAGATLSLALISAAAWHGDAQRVIHALALAASLRLAAFVVIAWRAFGRGHRVDAAVGDPAVPLGTQLRFSLPLGLTLATSVLNRTVDKWWVAAFDPSAIGDYTIAAQEIPLLAVLPYAGGAAIAARMAAAFAQGDHERAADAWREQTATMARLLVPITVALIVVAPEILQSLVGHSTTTMTISFQLFTAITLHRVAEYGLLLRAAGRPRATFASALVLLAGNAVLAGVGAAWFGAVGAAAGALIANLIAWLYIVRQVQLTLGCRYRDAFPWGPWFDALVASCGAAVVAVIVAGAATNPFTSLVLKLASMAAFMTAASVVRRRVPTTAGPWGTA
ncbi:MAG: oligosaccharide flippase family protein [Acidobacteria bacterium]|nr:oligosaccharide flippase family protein [Acidobacteriota bacterium]